MKSSSVGCSILLIFCCTQFAFGQEAVVNTVNIRSLVTRWNDAHNARDYERFKELYDARLIFYGKNTSREESIRIKREALEARPEFRQEITSPVIIRAFSSGVVKCEFTKTVNETKPKEYPSYLLLKDVGGKLVIVGESDLITDKRVGFPLAIGDPIPVQDLAKMKDDDSSLQSYAWGDFTYYGSLTGIAFLILFATGIIFRRAKRNAQPKTEDAIEPEIIFKPAIQISVAVPVTAITQLKAAADDNKAKGDAFEKCVVSRFDTQYFTLIEWRGDKGHDGIFPLSNMDPDLEYRFNHKNHTRFFAVECKYRSVINRDKVVVMTDAQLARYENFGKVKNMPVFVVVGIGGTPDEPAEIYCIPLTEFKRGTLRYHYMKKFRKGGNFFFDPYRDMLS